jgi:hypothetical protein
MMRFVVFGVGMFWVSTRIALTFTKVAVWPSGSFKVTVSFTESGEPEDAIVRWPE